MSFTIVLPIISPDHAERCIASMHHSIVDEHLLVVDNTKHNRGVAASWNIGAREVVDRQRDYLVLCSEAITFHQQALDLMRHLEERRNEPVIATLFGWKLKVIHRLTIQRVGYFDEGFYPAYFEDTDFLYRMGLAGLPSPRENGRSFHWIDVDAEVGPDAHALTAGLVKVEFRKLTELYERKWGGPQGEERYETPWNLPDVDWSYWPPP